MAHRDQRARLLALTRAAYGASEGVDLDWAEGDGKQVGQTPQVETPVSSGQRRARAPDRSRGRQGTRLRVQVSARAVVGIAACLITVLMVVVARSVMSAQALDLAPGTSHTYAVSPSPSDASPSPSDAPPTQPDAPSSAPSASASAVPSASASPSAALSETVVVHVAGNVERPGLVSLPGGSRVADALAGAGGATTQADLDALNLARVVVDGEQIYVPAPGEVPPGQASNQSVPSAGSSTGRAGESPVGPVNLNTAQESELDALPGVGPAIAGRIVAWREQHGGFTEVEELTEVSGIGPATLERLRPLVTV